MLNKKLKSSVSQLWDKFWSGGISNPLTAIEQISYLLFMKRLDELDLKKQHDAEFTGEAYKSIFAGENKNNRWSYFRQMEGGEMLTHVQNKVFPFLKTLGKDDSSFAKHMGNAVFIVSKPSLLVEAVEIIDEIFIEISKQESEGQGFQDTQGDLYEYLLSEITSAGKLGQFRTPRHIIQLICELVDPKLGDTICDPACGTGGFLLGAYHHILTSYTSKQYRQTDENGLERGLLGDKLIDERQWKHLKEKTFYGYDVDESMVRIGLMNLMMHGISDPNIEQKDTLSKKYIEDDRFDVIMANPPFKGSIDKGDINESLSLDTSKTELLFVNRIIKSLKIGGRAGVIVPDGVLFGKSRAHEALRKMLVETCELQAVISLPPGVFLPYADASTAILIFVKGGTTEKVWFYNIENDGYSLDDKRSKLDSSDLPKLVELWKRNELEEGLYVDINEIRDNNYSLIDGHYRKSRLDSSNVIPKEWNLLPLGEIVEEVNSRNGSNTNLVLSITKYEGFVESKKYFKKQVFSQDLSKYKLVLNNQFAYSTIHLDEGAIGYLNNFESGVISPMYKVFRIKNGLDIKINPTYLYHLLKSEQYIQIYKNLGKGSVKRRKSVSFAEFSSVKVLIPPEEVQLKIEGISKDIEMMKKKVQQSKSLLQNEMNEIVSLIH